MRGSIAIGILLTVAGVTLALWKPWRRVAVAPPPPPASQPAPVVVPTLPPTRPAEVVHDWDSLLKSAFVNSPPRKLDTPADLPDAARIRVSYPTYLGSRGDLWITSPAGQAAFLALRRRGDDPLFVVRERVAFVDWQYDGVRRVPMPVLHAEPYTLADLEAAPTFAADEAPDFAHAISVDPWTVVATSRGATAFRTRPFERLDHAIAGDTPVVLQRLGGRVLAYRPGFAGAVAFDGKFDTLKTKDGWPRRLVHVLPLADGSARAIGVDDVGGASIGAIATTSVTLDRERVLALIAQLSDPDGGKRRDADAKLRSLGNSLWPIAQEVMESQPPEGRVRLTAMLAEKLAPSLIGFSPANGTVRVVARAADGSVVLESADGWRVDGDERSTDAARILIRPGARPIVPTPDLDQLLVGGTLQSASGELVLLTTGAIYRVTGGAPVKLLDGSDRRFDDFLGIDRAGRWVFANQVDGHALLIDPMLAETSSRLPLWHIVGQRGFPMIRSIGGWPAMSGTTAWTLRENGWEPQDCPAIPEGFAFEACEFTSDTLVVRRRPGGRATSVTLPAELKPVDTAAKAVLLRDGVTVLAALRPGTITRLKLSAEGVQVTAIHALPIEDQMPVQLWLDPAGRVCALFDDGDLVIGFPDGVIPASINALMVGRPSP